jgi:hypothetical protein
MNTEHPEHEFLKVNTAAFYKVCRNKGLDPTYARIKMGSISDAYKLTCTLS